MFFDLITGLVAPHLLAIVVAVETGVVDLNAVSADTVFAVVVVHHIFVGPVVVDLNAVSADTVLDVVVNQIFDLADLVADNCFAVVMVHHVFVDLNVVFADTGVEVVVHQIVFVDLNAVSVDTVLSVVVGLTCVLVTLDLSAVAVVVVVAVVALADFSILDSILDLILKLDFERNELTKRSQRSGKRRTVENKSINIFSMILIIFY